MHIKKIGQGKDLVLIHGWGMHSGIWEPIIEKFSNQYTLHLVDIPGMGKSDSIDPYDLNHLVEAISQKLPSSFDILGWSLGGLIALKMSLIYPQKIDRMVLVGGNDLRDDINKINHKTLLIVGDMDRLTPKSASIWLEGHLKEARLKVIQGASHIPFLSHSHEFFDHLDQFLLAA
jgi:pimeloyl-ACP methyl ester carboxylesterase